MLAGGSFAPRLGSGRGGIIRFSLTMAEGVENQFDAAGDAELVENAEEVILNRMLAEVELLGDFAVGEALSDAGDHLLLALAEQALALGVDNVKWRHLAQGFQDELQFAIVGPDLALVHANNALAQHFEGLGAAENTAGTAAESIHYQVPVGGIQQQNGAGAGMGGTQLA